VKQRSSSGQYRTNVRMNQEGSPKRNCRARRPGNGASLPDSHQVIGIGSLPTRNAHFPARFPPGERSAPLGRLVRRGASANIQFASVARTNQVAEMDVFVAKSGSDTPNAHPTRIRQERQGTAPRRSVGQRGGRRAGSGGGGRRAGSGGGGRRAGSGGGGRRAWRWGAACGAVGAPCVAVGGGVRGGGGQIGRASGWE
jgi:hypothetical protein